MFAHTIEVSDHDYTLRNLLHCLDGMDSPN